MVVHKKMWIYGGLPIPLNLTLNTPLIGDALTHLFYAIVVNGGALEVGGGPGLPPPLLLQSLLRLEQSPAQSTVTDIG